MDSIQCHVKNTNQLIDVFEIPKFAIVRQT